MKRIFTFIVCTHLAMFAKAQNLQVQQAGGKFYLDHTVAPKENWYSIGRMYNLSPGAIAPFNGLATDKGLSIGDKLKVPLQEQNFVQQGQPATDEAFIPVYHTVEGKEGLYRIGQNFNKVSVDQLKAWNNLKGDEVSIGSSLIVGFLRVKKDLSPLAGASAQLPAAPVAKTVTPEPKPQPPVEKPVVPVVKPEPKPEPKPISPPAATTTVRSDVTGDEGAFASVYRDQSRGNNQVTGVAGVFKSTSGWKDGKYYVLMNKVTPGTIVKITSVSNSRTVYAKVLGEIPPGKENEGLLIRISNAASAQLQMPETSRFDVQLTY
jgi:LysM repeat protein